MKDKEKGQIVIMVCLFMLALIILFSLVADVGKIYLWQKKLEMAVDAAALAGGQEYALKLTSLGLQPLAKDKARSVAISYAGINGADTNNVVVRFLDELNDTVPGTDGIEETLQVDATKMVPLMFTKMLGITGKQIWASAATRIGRATSIGGGGVAPWGPPDMNYQNCKRYIIKRGISSRLPGGGGAPNFGGLALGDGQGANWYRDNIAPGPPGFTGILRVGDMITTEPGNMVGPTASGTQARLNACPHTPKCGGCNYVPGCPRVIVVPIINIFKNGRIKRPILRFEAFVLDDKSLDSNQKGLTKMTENGPEELRTVGNEGITATYIGGYVAPSGEMGGLNSGGLTQIKVTQLVR